MSQKTGKGRRVVEEIHTEIKEELRSRSLVDRHIDELLGLKPGGFNKQRARCALRMEDLVEILQLLDLDTYDLLGRIAALQRSSRTRQRRKTPSRHEDGLTEAALMADEMRYEDPIATLAFLKAFLRLGGNSLLFQVLGSTFRLLELDDLAEKWIRKGLGIATCDHERANALQRLAFARASKSSQEAKTLLDDAAKIYSEAGHREGYAETLVDRGTLLFANNKVEASHAYFLAAACCVSQLSPRNNVAIYQHLAKIYHLKGMPSLAERAISCALSSHNGALDSYSRGHLQWTSGLFRNDPGLLDLAIGSFSKAHLYHAIGAGLDKCRLQPASTASTLEKLFQLSQSQPEFRDLLEQWIDSVRLRRLIAEPHDELRLAWDRWRFAQARQFGF